LVKYNINFSSVKLFVQNIFGVIFAYQSRIDMKKPAIVLISILSLLILYSCSSDPSKKLIGTWKAVDVQTEFNESDVTPEMLKQVVEREKKTYFRIVDDSTLVIITSNNTHEARWVFDDENDEITYFFEGMETDPNKLGKLEEDRIVMETKTPIGRIIKVYERE
jgi:hypothetical protein